MSNYTSVDPGDGLRDRVDIRLRFLGLDRNCQGRLGLTRLDLIWLGVTGREAKSLRLPVIARARADSKMFLGLFGLELHSIGHDCTCMGLIWFYRARLVTGWAWPGLIGPDWLCMGVGGETTLARG